MKDYLEKLPLELKNIVCSVAEVSRETKMPAYLVGGVLRDLILGVKNLDLDIAIEGSGIIFAQVLSEKLKSSLKTHERFGTATLILSDKLKVDIATCRQEQYSCPGALPAVSPGSLSQDLRRRDFTINAMALRLSALGQQEIIDPFGGQADLSGGRIRILHALSFTDDPTRIFRAVRFSRRFNFKIESKTLVLLKKAIRDGLLGKVNPHRLRDELVLILKEPDPFKPVKKLSDLGALFYISPKLKISKSSSGLFKSMTKEISWFAKNFPARRRLDNWLIYLGGLVSGLTVAQVKMITTKLGLRKGEEIRLVSFCRAVKKVIPVSSKRQLPPEKIFALLEPLTYETIILLSGICKNKNFKKHLAVFFEIYNGMRLCISGNDLGGLGVLPGPEYQKIFAKVLVAKLNGKLSSRQAELDLIKKLVKNK